MSRSGEDRSTSMAEMDQNSFEEVWTEKGSQIILTTIAKRNKSGAKVYNMFCSECSNLVSIFPIGFTITKDQFVKRRFPCLCGKAPKLEDWQLRKVLDRKLPDHYSIGAITGKGAQKRADVFCHKCAEDWELFPSATFNTKVSHLKDGIVPCGCSKSHRRTPYERSVKVKRFCSSKGYELISSTEDFKKIEVFNPKTDNSWTIPFDYLSNKKSWNDPSERGRKVSEALRLPDSVHIAGFLSTGKYKEATTFTRLEREVKADSFGRGVYWEVTCGSCKEKYTSSIGHLKAGQVGCSCRGGGGYCRTSRGNFYIVRWFGYGESYLKFGITNREVLERIKEQDSASEHLDYEILEEFYHNDGGVVADCETHLKKVMPTKACPKRWLPDGYTETVEDTPENLQEILEIISTFNLSQVK